MEKINDFNMNTDWTITMIEAKIHEIENQLRILQQEYNSKTQHLLIDLELMYKLWRIRKFGED